jgi:hypothetical protein
MLRDTPPATEHAPAVLALLALAHVAGDSDLGPRFLALSGLDADTLRAGAGDPVLLAALIDFLSARETDLVATAAAIGATPGRLAAAGAALRDGRA